MTDKHLAKKWILSFARFVEVTVGVIVAIALVISCISLFINLGFFDGEWVDAEYCAGRRIHTHGYQT